MDVPQTPNMAEPITIPETDVVKKEVKRLYQVTMRSFLTFQTIFCLLKGKMFPWVLLAVFHNHVNLTLTTRNWAPHVLTVKKLNMFCQVILT
ncbi:hypothetical protein QYM36_013255 [Artemia franciscana]|uniref:Uncharacterized protein n=1 Tax=Artemia franciscana TaxID=6661 RepID=A0AA88HCK2_ARTSF|nr:hypothetical protein QYM36_013255 [Artemia franciscana]